MESVRKRTKPFGDKRSDGSEFTSAYTQQPKHGIMRDKYEIDQSQLRHLIPEAFLGYIWWSIFFSLASTIWFFPLNLLEISGYEAFALVCLSPVITLIPFIDKLVCSSYGIITSQLFTVIGVLSYHMPSALSRLLLVCFGIFFAMLWLCGAWWCKSKAYRDYAFWGLTIGFFIKLVLQINFLSLNPLWASSVLNMIIFAIGMICTIDRANFIQSINLDDKDNENKQYNKQPSFSQWVIVSLGAGAWLFLAQWLYGEVSVVSRYIGDEYPSLSPTPVPGGILVLLALTLGIVISSRTMITSSGWWLFGGLSALIFYKASSLLGYFGGLGLAVYTMSIFPRISSQLSKCSKGKSLTLALLVCIVFLLASVWVVAFNFVPGGVYARERNDLILAFALIFMGFSVAVDLESKDQKNEATEARVGQHDVSFSDQKKKKKESLLKDAVLPVVCFLFLIGSLFMVGRYYQREFRRRNSKLAVRDPKQFTAMVWTVHFGYDNQGWHNFKQSVQLMNDTGADVIGILESDCSRPYVGSTDFVSYIEEELGFYSDYGPKTKDHTWGAAIISRYPIIASKHYLLPSPEGELAPALLASINMTGQIVDFVVVHMGNDRDDLDRKLQAEELAKIMDSSKNPIVFLGYVTSAPGSRDYLHLLEAGRTKDIDYEDNERWCEYIFYRDLIREAYARISHGELSDTEVQAAKFRIPKNLKSFEDNNAVTTTSSDVDNSIHFSEKFGDFHIGHFHGEGHHFHMSTPKYFVPAQS